MKYYSITEFASKTNTTRQNIHQAIQRGRVKASQLGTTWMIQEGELSKWLAIELLDNTTEGERDELQGGEDEKFE